jgi:hypothetical protein
MAREIGSKLGISESAGMGQSSHESRAESASSEMDLSTDRSAQQDPAMDPSGRDSSRSSETDSAGMQDDIRSRSASDGRPHALIGLLGLLATGGGFVLNLRRRVR